MYVNVCNIFGPGDHPGGKHVLKMCMRMSSHAVHVVGSRVCMYICPSYFNCVGVVSVVSSLYYEPRSAGLTTRRSRRDRARVEMEQAWYWSDLEAIDM